MWLSVENQTPSRTFGPLHSGILPRLEVQTILEQWKKYFLEDFLFYFSFWYINIFLSFSNIFVHIIRNSALLFLTENICQIRKNI